MCQCPTWPANRWAGWNDWIPPTDSVGREPSRCWISGRKRADESGYWPLGRPHFRRHPQRSGGIRRTWRPTETVETYGQAKSSKSIQGFHGFWQVLPVGPDMTWSTVTRGPVTEIFLKVHRTWQMNWFSLLSLYLANANINLVQQLRWISILSFLFKKCE